MLLRRGSPFAQQWSAIFAASSLPHAHKPLHLSVAKRRHKRSIFCIRAYRDSGVEYVKGEAHMRAKKTYLWTTDATIIQALHILSDLISEVTRIAVDNHFVVSQHPTVTSRRPHSPEFFVHTQPKHAVPPDPFAESYAPPLPQRRLPVQQTPRFLLAPFHPRPGFRIVCSELRYISRIVQ